MPIYANEAEKHKLKQNKQNTQARHVDMILKRSSK